VQILYNSHSSMSAERKIATCAYLRNRSFDTKRERLSSSIGKQYLEGGGITYVPKYILYLVYLLKKFSLHSFCTFTDVLANNWPLAYLGT